MYCTRFDPVTLRRKMENRRWKKTESFSVYFHDKLILGNNDEVGDHYMIHYVIEGFDSKMLQNQARMMLTIIVPKNFSS